LWIARRRRRDSSYPSLDSERSTASSSARRPSQCTKEAERDGASLRAGMGGGGWFQDEELEDEDPGDDDSRSGKRSDEGASRSRSEASRAGLDAQRCACASPARKRREPMLGSIQGVRSGS